MQRPEANGVGGVEWGACLDKPGWMGEVGAVLTGQQEGEGPPALRRSRGEPGRQQVPRPRRPAEPKGPGRGIRKPHPDSRRLSLTGQRTQGHRLHTLGFPGLRGREQTGSSLGLTAGPGARERRQTAQTGGAHLEELDADAGEHELQERGDQDDIPDGADGHKHALHHMLGRESWSAPVCPHHPLLPHR